MNYHADLAERPVGREPCAEIEEVITNLRHQKRAGAAEAIAARVSAGATGTQDGVAQHGALTT
eukprot:514652-Lingulodinium_polyedra.AAC.1